MKQIASILSIMLLWFSLLSCSGGGSGAGGGNTQAFAVSTTSATYGVVGNAYSSTLATANGTAPYTWSLLGGTLPVGLTVNVSTGVVTGTPTAAGNSTATFTVRDSTGKTATGSVLFAAHDRTDRVSVDGSGFAGSGVGTAPSLSSDGSLVAFVSLSTNFVPGVSGTQIYVHNRQTNQIDVVSRDSSTTAINGGDGVSSGPAISTDGRFVVFASQSANLVSNVSGTQVYVRDRQTGQTTVVSKSSVGTVGNGVSNTPAISADGQYVAFVSAATNLVSGVSGTQIYRHDRTTGTTILISKNNNVPPVAGDGVSSSPSISSDGRYVAFASLSTNLVSGVGANQQIYFHDTQTGANGTTSLISKDTGTNVAGNGASSAPVINGTGQFVAFVSAATNIVSGFSGQQVYLHDRNTGVNGTNSLISRNNSGSPSAGDQNSGQPSISSDGRYVTFTSSATNLLTGISGQQIYQHDRNGPTTSLVSRDNSGSLVAGNGSSDSSSINGGGGFVAFSSLATNFVGGGGTHIYVRAMP